MTFVVDAYTVIPDCGGGCEQHIEKESQENKAWHVLETWHVLNYAENLIYSSRCTCNCADTETTQLCAKKDRQGKQENNRIRE